MDQGFSYDALDRLTSQTVNGTSFGYSYDSNGNRTSKVVGGTTYTNTVDPGSNKLTQTQDASGTANPQYDAAGNVTADGTNTFVYSDRGRMSSAATPSGSVTMLYNGRNRRAYKSSSIRTSYYVHDEADRLLSEADANGNPIYETVYFGSAPVGAIKQGVIYNVYADQIGTPRLITMQDHAIVWRWDTAEAFGATVPNQDPSGRGVFPYNQGMPGQIRDLETGLYDNGHRTYDGRGGRFDQPDPIGQAGGSNLFLYAQNDSLRKSDATGLCPMCLAIPLLTVGGISLTDIGIGAAIGGALIGLDRMFSKDFVDDPQAKAEHDEYKRQYQEPPPPFKDPCDELRWRLKREENLLRARQAWDAKWLPGRHAGMNGEIQSQNAIRKLKEKMKQKGCDCA